MSYQQKSLRNLSIAYISAFLIVVLLATLSQIIVQMALGQEVVSRQASTSISQRIVYSQRMQRDTVLLIGTEDRTSSDKELASDLVAIQESAAAYTKDYPGYAAEVRAALPADATVQYKNVIHAGTALVALEKKYGKASYKTRLAAESPYITLLFYSEIKQLGYLQKAQQIVDSDSDAYIAHIRLVEIFLYALNMLVWLYELFVVLIPTTRRFATDLKALDEPKPATSTAPIVSLDDVRNKGVQF